MDSFNKNLEFSQSSFRNSQYNAVVQKLFTQINSIIHHLLGYITSVYQLHGINFSVLQHQTVLLRMLTPYQLYNNPIQFDTNDFRSQNFSFPQLRGPFNESLNNSMMNQNYFKNKKSNYPQERNNQRINNGNNLKKKINLEEGLQIGGPQMEVINNFEDARSPKTRNYKTSCGGRPILQPHEQQQVRNFIQSEALSGNLLTMQIIGMEAKRIAKNNEHFLGSVGWVKNFFRRFPKMKQYYRLSRTSRHNYRDNNYISPTSNYNINDSYIREYKQYEREDQNQNLSKKNNQSDQLSSVNGQNEIYSQSNHENNQTKRQFKQQNQSSQQNIKNIQKVKLKKGEKYVQPQQSKQQGQQQQRKQKRPNEDISSYNFTKVPSKTYQRKVGQSYM